MGDKRVPGRRNKLIEYYQQLAQKEKVERDRKKLARRRNYMPLAFSVRTWYRGVSNSLIKTSME